MWRHLSDKTLSIPHLFTDSDVGSDTLYNFFGLICVILTLTVITFFIWKKCLFEKYGAYLPLDKNIDTQQLNKRKVLMSTKTYSSFKMLFFPLLDDLKVEYWCTHCGVDGYMYLLFQRRFMKLCLFMAAISIIGQLVLFVTENHSESLFGIKQKEARDFSVLNVVSGLIGREHELSDIQAGISISIIAVFTLITIWTV